MPLASVMLGLLAVDESSAVKDCKHRLEMPVGIDRKYLHPLARCFRKETGRNQG